MSTTALLAIDWASRRELTRAGDKSAPFASLADGLSRELEPLINAELPIPVRKARMTRYGGRCPVHGVYLDFDPWSPNDHRCPRCDKTYRDSKHDDWWAMGAQLWTAERAVHAAALFALRGSLRHGELAARILRTYAERYHTWPNADNVLGPSRPFFSTYLESIWLLNLCHALALLEGHFDEWTVSDGDALRAQLIEPSAALIASYNEGRSNRQVWNEVAINSAWCMLHREADVRSRLDAEYGIRWHITNSLDHDGSWYEGENYHLFAHRGLWYGVQLMRALGESLAPPLNERYSAGFVAPFAGLLPDDTFPSRRDSKYGSSIRQWRIAEWCELGWAHTHDRRVAGILSRLYHGNTVRRDTGRTRSTADAEQKELPSSLTRADLSWRGLLMADAEPAPDAVAQVASECLPDQGLAVIRRDFGRAYVALEGGQLGGGHGHPDQLALTLQVGDARFLEDPGTGSYVDEDLKWYRSTLAHAAPRFDGRDQRAVAATLVAFEDNSDFGWMVKRVDGIAEGVQVERAIVVGNGYAVDVLEWKAAKSCAMELPIAGKADVISRERHGWQEADAEMRGDLVFSVGPLKNLKRSAVRDTLELLAYPTFAAPMPSQAAPREHASGDAAGDAAHVWYSIAKSANANSDLLYVMNATVPAAPGLGYTDRHWILATGNGGRMVGVWSWPTRLFPQGIVSDVEFTDEAMPCVRITTRDGITEAHTRTDAGWRIDVHDPRALRSVVLAGFRPVSPKREAARVTTPSVRAAEYTLALRDQEVIPANLGEIIPGATVISLGEPHYVRTEQSWMEAGAPSATVQLIATPKWFVVEVHMRTGPIVTSVPDENGRLDNEHPEVNADGLQWYMASASPQPHVGPGWYSGSLVVPGNAEGVPYRERPYAVSGYSDPPVVFTTPMRDGWAIRLIWARKDVPVDDNGAIDFELVVNERPPGRERRRGQLVLSGGGGFGYLAGWDRPRNRFVRLVLPWERAKTTFR